MSKELYVYIDGKYLTKSEAKISVYDHGLLYGDGVFEGIRAYNNKVLKLEEHVNRIFASAKAIDLQIPISKKEMIAVVVNTYSKNNRPNGYSRLVVTRGFGDLGLNPLKCKVASVICIVDDISMYPQEMYDNGMPIITASQRRNKAVCLDPQIKSLNYLNNIMARIEANRAGVSEALMLTSDGIVTECTGDNIFIVKDGVVYTPPIHVGILEGITRNLVMELAIKNGIKVVEKEFTLYNLYNADECFLTGTAAEVISVTKVDERVIGAGVAGEISKKLLAVFHEYVRENGTPIK